MKGALLAFVLLGPSLAVAQPLRLPEGTSPRSLSMRASAFRLAAADDEVGDADRASPQAAPERGIFSLPTGDDLELAAGDLDRLGRHRLEQDVIAPQTGLSESVVFRFSLGMGLDGGQPSGDPTLAGALLDEGQNYQRLRIYSFGDAVIGSRGLGVDSLNSYLAAHFRLNQNFSQNSTALPSIYDEDFNQPLVRSAYAELDQPIDLARLQPLYFRAGRSFNYGLSPVQFDGLTVGYDTRALKLSVFGGQRSSLYSLTNDSYANEGVVSGSNVRIDFFEWRRWPLVIFASTLSFDAHDHFRTGLALRWHRDVLVSTSLRTLDGDLARSDLSVRARLSQVTTVNASLSNRSRYDWRFGMLQIDAPDSPADPRRYLDLGPVLPRSYLSVRYGTVLLRNLDLLLRAGGALDRRDREIDAANSFSSSYAEGGGAVEVHVRRTLRIGAAVSTRSYFLDDDKIENQVPGRPEDLPTSLGSTGASSFWEGGLSFMYSAGARQFSASAEFYGRRYSLQSEYLTDNQGDFRSGGRFSAEGWAAERIRLRTEYDVSFNQLAMAPELRGLKTLRVLMEGSF